MTLLPLAGHLAARTSLGRAAAAGRLPQSLLLTGPVGVGKQRLALWLAQLVQCDRSGQEPCGECRGCTDVLGLQHPDVHWLIPVPRPKGGDADKQVEEVAELIADAVSERRTSPRYAPPDGMASHGIATVRLLQRSAALTSVAGRRKVFILPEADRLVAQESSPEAANALLKLLEEPPADTVFILTTSDAHRLLPTIRSRVLVLRLAPLADRDVRNFFAATEPSLDAEELERRVQRAAGLIGAGITAGEDAQAAQQAASAILEAVLTGPGPRLERALRQQPWSARGDFTAVLDAVAETLNEAARSALGERPRLPVPEALRARTPDALLGAMDRVSAAREAAYGNVNPQLLLAVLSEDLASLL